jgi:GntR family transcriptional regulator, transcriptional repressor for pyruvate dehydrogenase complex
MPVDVGWAPIRTTGSLSAQVVEQILAKVRDQQLRPGDRLPPERELAALLGVSRSVVREAIQILAAHGQVDVHHGRGVFLQDSLATQSLRAVAAAQEYDLLELFAMREVLEVPAAGWAAERAMPEDIVALRADLDRLDRAARPEPDLAAMHACDSTFHLHIVELAGNRFLLQTVGVLQEMLRAGIRTTLHVPGRYERSRADHHQIVDALEDGDAAAAIAGAREHLAGAFAAARAWLHEPRSADDASAGA